MHFRAVGNRCAVDLSSLELPISESEALRILVTYGFVSLRVDPVSVARALIGKCKYARGAPYELAPAMVDCSSFVKWVYAEMGIWIPRLSIQQSLFGREISLSQVQAGDVICTPGRVNFYDKDPARNVGHIGLATGEGTVVHAVGSKIGVVEVSQAGFVSYRGLSTVRRYLPSAPVHVMSSPQGRSVEWSDDFRWIILSRLEAG